MDPSHRTYLGQRAQLIADRLTVLAERTTTDRPAWSQDLGPAPEDAATRAVWQRHLATIAAYRDQYQVTDNNPAQPAGPYIENGRAGHQAYWHAAAAALTAKNPKEFPSTTHTAESSARQQLTADVFRNLPEAEQTAILHNVAHRTGATWLTTSPGLDGTALRTPAIAEPLAAVLTEGGHLTAEARPTQDAGVRREDQAAPGDKQPTLADRRRTGRAAERQAHREQLQQRGSKPNPTATAPHGSCSTPARHRAPPREPAAQRNRARLQRPRSSPVR